jgi:DNA-binding NtrC family response regulator
MKSFVNNDYYYILLVDDEKDILDLFSAYLSSREFNIISFQNPLKH